MGGPLKIGIYSPFFGSTLGGGEKYLGVTAEAVRDAFPDHQVEIVTPVPVDRQLYERTLNLDLSGIRFVATNRRVTWLHRALNRMPTLRLYRDLFIGAQAVQYTRAYDLFIAMVYVIPVFSMARASVMLCQFPYQREKEKQPRRVPAPLFAVYSFPYHVLRHFLFPDDIRCFQEIVCQSEYVRGWVQRYWKRDALVINPPIDVPAFEPAWGQKRPIILSVGRYFTGGHEKRHDVMVRVFRDLCDGGLSGWELHLAGSVHRDGHNAGYFKSIEELARGYPIVLHPDAPYAEVQDLYRRASIYWHAAGFGANPGDPALLEHFGMTTAEAMGHGVVPVAIGSGGQLEVVVDEVDGYLWRDLEQLKARTLALINDAALRRRLAAQARAASQRFSRPRFTRQMLAALAPLVRELEGERALEVVGQPQVEH
jgi:glycosyltransferase involved in cell wall biosynthesis